MSYFTTLSLFDFSPKCKNKGSLSPLKMNNIMRYVSVVFFIVFSHGVYGQGCTSGGDQTTYGNGSWIGYVYSQEKQDQNNPSEVKQVQELWNNEAFGKQDRSKELINKRDAFSKHFKNGDGNVKAHIASGPIHYQENGEWKTIYHTISPSANGFENIHNSFKTYYPATATGEIKTILPNGGTISDMISMKMYFEANGQKINVQSIKNAPGQASFNELTYTNAYGNGIDLRLTQNTTKRKMDYIIHSLDALGNIPSNVNNLVFEESVALPTGWKAVLENNEILLIDERGAVQAKYEKPIFEDAPFTDKTERNNEKAVSAENTDKETISELSNRETIQNVNGSLRSKVGQYEIVQNGNILTIKTLVEVNWLTSEDRVFPLTIDPTMDFYPTTTSHTGHTDGGNNYCAYGFIAVGRPSNYFIGGWSKFLTMSLPSCININSTVLNYNIYYNSYFPGDGQIIQFMQMNDADSYGGSCAGLLNGINSGGAYVNTGLMGNEGTGWKAQNLGAVANIDVSNAAQFTVGYRAAGSFLTGEYIQIRGENHADKPYLTVNYTILTVDAGPDKEICAGESVELEGSASTIPGFTYFEDFNGCNASNCHGWTISGGYDPYIDEFLSCSNSSACDNIWSGNPDSYVTSNNPVFTSNGQPATFSFVYATVFWSDFSPLNSGYCTFNVQWSTNGSTWNTISTFSNVSNLNCNPHTSTFTPPAGQPVYLRVHAHRNNGDFLYSIDDISVTQAAAITWSGGPIVSGQGTMTPTVNPTETTTYTLTATSGSCSLTDQVTVNVSPSSTPPTASTGGGNYCHGNRITLTQSGGTDASGAVDVWYAAEGETSPNPNSCDNESYIELWNDFKYNDPTCEYLHKNTSYSTSNGILQLETINTSTDTDPFIWMYPLVGNATIDANTYEYVNVRYKITNLNPATYPTFRMGVLFTKESGCGVNPYPFSGAGSTNTFDTDNNVWHTVSFKMSDHVDWDGTITGLRFDYFDKVGNSPVHNIPIGSKMEVDFIIVSKHPMIGEGTSITLSPGDEYYPTQTTTYYAKKIDNCGATSCVNETVVLPVPGTDLALNNESATCVVNNGERVHFYHESGRLITTIDANSGNLGEVTAIAYVDAGAQTVQACDFNNYETTVMQRHWVITPTNQSPASVYLPFTDAEYNDLVATANNNQNPHDDLFSLADLKLSKYGGPNNINSNYEDNCITMGGNHDPNQPTASQATTLHDINGNGSITIADGYVEPISGAQFVQFNIPSFSEFWLHGQNANSPLPVTLTSFSASCKENVMLSWTTASEQNSDRFVVEKSRDGVTWEFVGEQTAAGNSNAIKNYSQTDHTTWNGVSYYRLRQIDFDGKEEIYGPISVSCDKNGSNISVYPNPNTGNFTVEINSSIEIENADLQLVDVTGKLVSSRIIQIANGVTQLAIGEKKYLNPGTYVLKVVSGEYFEPVKIVVR